MNPNVNDFMLYMFLLNTHRTQKAHLHLLNSMELNYHMFGKKEKSNSVRQSVGMMGMEEFCIISILWWRRVKMERLASVMICPVMKF